MFNTIVENKDHFIEKWQGMLESDNELARYKAKQFIEIITRARSITEFDADLYFAMVEKMTVISRKKVMVSLLDGTQVECETE